MEQTFNFSALNKFLYQRLSSTEEAKNVLKSNCEEAIFSLKPWCMKIITKQEDSNSACTCYKSKNEVEEIAAGIGRALQQTQQLREKLSFNAIKEKKNSKQLTTYEVYVPRVAGESKKKGIKNLNVGCKKLSSDQKIDITTKLNSQRLQIKSIKKGQDENVGETNDEKERLTRPAKLAQNRNFVAINKYNIKKYSSINHKSVHESKSNSNTTKTKYNKFNETSSVTSTNELKNLIQKVSLESNNYTVVSNENTLKCTLHGNVASPVTYEQNSAIIDVVDSLDAFNIPGEIIKPLKAYYTYLNIELSDKVIDNGKGQKMFNKFLVEFNKMDKNVEKYLTQETNIVVLSTNFISLFQSLSSKDTKISDLTSLKKMYAELSTTWAMYNTKEFNTSQIGMLDAQQAFVHRNIHAKGWMSNGIWNFLCIKNLEGMSERNYIYYASKHQLSLFFKIVQQLQQVQYFKDLIAIISKDVLSNMKVSFNHTKSEYVKVYKMISILYQGLNPKIPVLVRTDT